MSHVFPLHLVFLGAMSFAATANSDVTSTGTDQTSLSMTIYQNNLAHVAETRSISLHKGINQVAFEGISTNIQPESFTVHSSNTEQAQLTVLEQSFNYDLLTPQKLLDKYVGKEITIARTDSISNEEKYLQATVLSTNGGIVLQVGNSIEIGMPEKIKFPTLPDNLYSQPTLLAKINADTAIQNEIALSYLTSDLQWRADYIATINETTNTLDLQALVTISNQSGTSFDNVSINLIAGDVNRVEQRMLRPARSLMKSRSSVALESDVSAEPVGDYHLYTLPRTTNIQNNQSKQISLFQKLAIPIKKDYIFSSNPMSYYQPMNKSPEKSNARIQLTLQNRERDNLGIPLPKGIVRSYQHHSNKQLHYLGEDRIANIATDEKFTITLGQAFDITASKKQLNFKQLSSFSNQRENISESEYEIVLRNSKNLPVTVKVQEAIPGDWQILDSNLDYQKIEANRAQWQITIPAENTTTLRYRVKINY